MSKKIPLRQCVGCGEMKNKKEMLRVLKTEDEGIVLDTTGKKNGRGAYVCRNAECLQKAKKTKGLDRSFKMTIPEEVYDSLTKEIEALEARQNIFHAWPGDEGRQGGKWRICSR